jgi:DNA-binding NarL/FixJ family response regulator
VDRTASPEQVLDELTPRQTEVLALVAEGHSNAAIARRLAISEKAVVRHLSLIYEALRLRPNADEHRRVLAVKRYLTRGRA